MPPGVSPSAGWIQSALNEGWYLRHNADVAAAVARGEFSRAEDHFLRYGSYEGRDPSLFFSPAKYLEDNADVALGVADGSIASAWEHYRTYGYQEARSFSIYYSNIAISGDLTVTVNKLFDADYYLSRNADVAAAIASGSFNSAFDHYLSFGAQEERAPSLIFNPSEYLANNTDVAAAKTLGHYTNALYHLLEYGQYEVRQTSSAFDGAYYLQNQPDVAAQGIAPLQHFLAYGALERRNPAAGATIGESLNATRFNNGQTAFEIAFSTVIPSNTTNSPSPLKGATIYTLTANVDSPSLSVFDDMITAEDSAHWQITDSISGGAGHDMLIINAGNALNVNFTNGQWENVSGVETFKLLANAAHSLVFHNDYFTRSGGILNNTVTVNASAVATGMTVDASGVISSSYLLNVTSGLGNDTVTGGAGADTLDGGTYEDALYGGDGDDLIYGQGGADSLYGGNGSDTINGGRSGNNIDIMYGGNGNDFFLFDYTDAARYAASPSTGAGLINGTGDYIEDFVQGQDKIVLDNVPFTGIQAGASTGSLLGYTYDVGTGYTIISYGYAYYASTTTGTIFYLQAKGNITFTNADFIFNYGSASGLFYGTTGKDGIVGSAGDDTIIAGAGDDEIYTGAGNDIVLLNGDAGAVLNSAGVDTIVGNYGDYGVYIKNHPNNSGSVFFGNAGSDLYYGSDNAAGHDIVYMGRGDDSFANSFSGNDFLDGGEGNDMRLIGGVGNDTLHGGYGADGQTSLTGGTGAANSSGVDTFLYYDPLESSTTETDIISAFTVGAGVNRDIIAVYGFTGIAAGAPVGTTLGYVYDGTHTVITSIAQYNFQLKLVGNYTVTGTPFDVANNFSFRAGILGTNGADGTGAFAATGGGEFIIGLEGNDTIDAGGGNDSVFGGHDADSLAGGLGDDSISGGYADDILIGGGGADTLEGGSGADRFVFAAGDSTAATPDVIWDFKHGNDADKIDLSAFGLSGFGALTIAYNGGIFTTITTAGGLQINLLGYYEAGTDITANDFVF